MTACGLRLPIRPGEGRLVGLSAAYFFTLLSSYYLVRPVRDEMTVRAGVGKIPWLFTATLAAMLFAVPLFGWIASRVPRRRLVPGMQVVFASHLVVFAAALRRPAFSGWAGPAFSGWAGPAFFVWLAVFNLFAVSLSWSLMTDLYRREQARRLFGLVAAGGSAGAVVAPAVLSVIAHRVAPERLLVAAAALLVVCSALAARLRPGGDAGGFEGSDAPIGGRALAGVGRTARSPFLLTVAFVLVCYTAVSTVLYFAQTEAAGAALRDTASRLALFARMDLAVNAGTIALQLLVTGALLRSFGIGGALAAVAGAVTLGLAGIGAAPGLAVVVAVCVLHRAGHFAVGRPAREVLFVSVDLEERYKAKSFIDTAVYRASDAGSAWLVAALRAHGGGLRETAWIAVPIAMAWTAASWALGRRRDARAVVVEDRPTVSAPTRSLA